MKKLFLGGVWGLVLLTFAISAQGDEQPSECYQSILSSRDFQLDKPAYGLGNAALDSAILTASSVAAIPTLAATLPAGAVLVIGHTLGAAAVKEAKVEGQNRLLSLLKESALFLEDDKQDIKEYPALRELWYRVNGPIFKKITPQQVAQSVLKAEYDVEFCQDPKNYRMVIFKDYVLKDLDG